MSEPIYFYTKAGPYFELSNFAPHGFEAQGLYWPTVEHFFQAQKFEDPTYRERIRVCSSPKVARELGQTRNPRLRAEWEAVREEVMLSALRLKFRDEKLRRILLDTKDQPLMEASPFDYFWGIGKDGSGQNRLGQLLMKVRGEL